jgi:ATP-dependent RNA helicase RhlE
VGRGKKKALLAHIINEHNWSQVLVFTRTKFGANNVAEFLTKNGISAMALHGNKSQTARTQALAGFKSGDIRALVATDIAARGIDIDELPHVVNYEIPNISEDYVHRIGRTGRAGSSGEAVSLVSLDEQGFMRDIEIFTKQQVPVVPVADFGPDADEKAEPIAMGRQTLWGGIGKPPGRDVMAAAAKAARSEMMQRVRDTKAAGGGRNGGGRGGQGGGEGRNSEGRAPRPNGHVSRDRVGDRPPRDGERAQFGDRPPRSGERPARDGNRPQGQGPRAPRQFDNRGPRNEAPRPPRDFDAPRAPRRDDDDFQPRANAHLGTQSGVNAFGHKTQGGGQRQPDPTRTSVDLMTERKRGGGGGGYGRRSGGGGGNRSGGGGGRSGGGGGGGYGR